MKTLKYMTSFLLLTLLSACQKEQLQAGSGPVVLRAEIAESKTVLDGLKVLWTETDRIVVNGVESSSIEIHSDRRSATFKLNSVQAPFKAVYPSSALAEAVPGGYGKLCLPQTQTWVEDSFDPSSAIMVASCEDESEGLFFRTSVSYLKLVFIGEDPDPVKRVELGANGGEDLSGVFVCNSVSGMLEAESDSGRKVSLLSPSGTAQGREMLVAIPARNYSSGLNMRVVDMNNHYQDLKSTAAFKAEPGVIYRTQLTFAPTGTLLDAETGVIGNKPVTKVLFIGNSHNLDATDLLPQMLNSAGVRNLEFTRVYHGAYYLMGYNTNYTKPNNCSITTWKSGQSMFRGSLAMEHSLQEAVEADTYDIVVMQEYAGNSNCWTWTQEERDAVSGLIQKIRRTSPEAEIVYFLSHCFSRGYKVLMEQFGNVTANQFHTCVENNARHIMDPSEGFGIKKIVSTGALVENLRTSGLNQRNDRDMLRGDGVHLDYGLTRYAASMLMWKTILTPVTGINPEDIPYRYPDYYPNAVKFNTPVTEENLPVVLAAVQAAYDNPMEITDLSSYSITPDYGFICPQAMLDLTGVDLEPVSFPVEFALGWKNGKSQCTFETQPYWNAYGIWQSTQPQAFAKWVYVSTPDPSLVVNHTWSNLESNDISSVKLDEVWTGDYFEFVIPVKDFKAGSTIRMKCTPYSNYAPVFWSVDYLDGEEWKSIESPQTAGEFTVNAAFALNNGSNTVEVDLPYENAVSAGRLRIRLRCADGSIQNSSSGPVRSDAPYTKNGVYAQSFCFWKKSQSEMSFSLAESGL